jgi:hypothetical protein
MKKCFLLLTVASFLALPVARASAMPQTPKPAKPASAPAAKPATHTVQAEVVEYDAAKHTLTIKDDKGETSSAPVEGRAMSQASHLKKGEKVMLTCRDNANGELQAVTAIRPAKAKS